MSDECFICAKHAAGVPGGEVAGDDFMVVSHLPLSTPAGSSESVYLGYLFVEPRRHVAELGELTVPESESLGRFTSSASRALQEVLGADHVYAAVIGHGVAHLHVHLIARYPGAPRDYWWTRVDEWPEAPRGGAAEVESLVGRLRATF